MRKKRFSDCKVYVVTVTVELTVKAPNAEIARGVGEQSIRVTDNLKSYKVESVLEYGR